MAETSTVLNPGAGGDRMHERQVTLADQVTTAKQPVVTIGGEIGAGDDPDGVADIVQPVNEDPGPSPRMLPVLPGALVNDTAPGNYVPGELRALSMTPEGRLRVASIPAYTAFEFFPEKAPFFAQEDALEYTPVNPYF